MAAPPPPLVFDTSFVPETGLSVPVADGIGRVTAPNAGPYTFTGTNSFLVGVERLAVIDPGPDDEDHLKALLAAIGGRTVEAILLTHTHKDHSSLAPRLKAATGAPVWFEGRHRLSRKPRLFELNGVADSSDWGLVPDRVLRDGEKVELGGMTLEVVATPGHCRNHLAFGVTGADVLLTGDHVMGWNSTLVSVPDGSMADYLQSLRKVIALPYRHYVPAHGGSIRDGRGYAEALLAHREMRNAQVVEAVGKGARRLGDLLRAIYPGLKLQLVPAALMTLKAHVEYLEGVGAVRARRGVWGMRLRPR
ncbi:MAG TPA: MBL fold metallo-hydrolase [Devosia sp.]